MNPFAPFKPPLFYDHEDDVVRDSRGVRFIAVNMSTKQAERDRLGPTITNALNRHAEEMEKEPKK